VRGTTAVIAAMRAEIAPLLALARIDQRHRLEGCRVYRGTLGGAPVVMAWTGEGAERAERGASALLERFAVSALVVVGVAGGLSPSLRAGMLIASRRVQDGSAPLPEPDAELLGRALRHEGVRAGMVLSSRRILSTAASKAEAGAALGDHEPAVVDLESAAFARVAAERRVGYLVVRAICDPAEEELPFDLECCRDGSGRVKRIKVVRQALRRPAAVGGLWSLRKRVALCADRLADLVQSLIEGGSA
jgi:adenosylhomocysteine nucleosidase